MSDPEIDRLRCGTCGRVGEQHAEGDGQCLRDALLVAEADADVAQEEIETLRESIATLRAELEAAKKERDEARGVEEYWKQHGEPIAAALRELAASRQSEERLRDVVFDVHHNFLSGLVGSWAAPNPPLCFCMEGGICPAIPIREDAKRFMEKTEAALAAPAPDKEKP